MNDHPNAGPYRDRHGRERWRFRRAGKTVALPHNPGHPEFEEAYLAAVEGRKPRKAEVKRHPSFALPRTLRAAWRIVITKTTEWQQLDAVTQQKQSSIAETFLNLPITDGVDTLWGEAPLADLKRRHLKALLAERSDRPHAARHLLVAIRKMILVGLDEEWIENDPSYRLNYRPKLKGWRAWTDDEREQFEKRWPIGTTPRLVYTLALWLGNRRSDVAALPVSAIRDDTIALKQIKTGREMRLSISPMLKEALDATDLKGPTILLTAYGNPFSAKSLTGRMADWTKAANLPKGCTLHGLRKTLGGMLADGGATTREIMDTLGHTDIKHAELYTKSANQERLARAGLGKVTLLHEERKKRGG
ncbi:tyrosine-type recombinase/integrase [Bosea lathyri]|uniref:Site-specific recombinase XerD n=1 Tax=Bosea lathyri TaxID=1036778 RepID=A0A1H5YYR9_9HYPH|nr:tyrosine-type recombinase/integrase [Bosea lathyri]SEG28940.1 Site-specific recombinase XerD [Bosea lathyri]